FLEPLRVGTKVLAGGADRERLVTQQLQRVGDVAGAAAEFAPQLGHHEGDGERVDLLGQYVIAELAGKTHDDVIGERSGYECFHAGVSFQARSGSRAALTSSSRLTGVL